MTSIAQLRSLLILPLFVLAACAQPQASEAPVEFTVVTYNVENLFDVDGVALFDDYKQGSETDPSGYSRAKFLTKLEAIAAVLHTVNEGIGPEVILFQELEADFTPESTVEDYDAFLGRHADTTVAAMLTTDWSADYAGAPAYAWLLKALADHGMSGYSVAAAPSKGLDSGIAHTNAVFSKFPIRDVRRHPIYQARDIIEAELDVAGYPLVVYVNHWKSGASNPEREPIRVENAKALRALIDARLGADPDADILVAGDLNSHYNHSILYPDIETGINDVLGSDGDESFGDNDLYNLWFELPPEARYSEVWRGRRGTLMHMLVTPGLYDQKGVSYVDGSFDKLVVPGLNADAIERPLEWSAWGRTGGGASDHFPLIARFNVEPFEATAPLSDGQNALDEELRLDYYECSIKHVMRDGSFLSEVPVAELGPYMGRMYQLNATVSGQRPFEIRVEGREWPTYTHNKDLKDSLNALEVGTEVELVVTLGEYRGQEQFIIEWMR